MINFFLSSRNKVYGIKSQTLRNIDYGHVYQPSDPTRDVKRNLNPDFIQSLDKMCLNSSSRSIVVTPSPKQSPPANYSANNSYHGNENIHPKGESPNKTINRSSTPLAIRQGLYVLKCTYSSVFIFTISIKLPS